MNCIACLEDLGYMYVKWAANIHNDSSTPSGKAITRCMVDAMVDTAVQQL